MAEDIFISYARPDLEFVQQLRQDLTSRGFSAWFDPEDNSALKGAFILSKYSASITAATVFLLVLSPDAVASTVVPEQVRLAKMQTKPIIPLIWRPVADTPMLKSYLQGFDRIDFAETASIENFNKLATFLGKYFSKTSAVSLPVVSGGGETVEVKSHKFILGNQQKLASTPKQTPQSSSVDYIALGNLLINAVIPLDLDPDKQDVINGELKWLFSAADNLLRIGRKEVARNQPIAVPIPLNAQKLPTANNQLLSTLADYKVETFPYKVSGSFKILEIALNDLNKLFVRETSRGEAAKSDFSLQNDIKTYRLKIAKTLQEVAQVMNEAYGVLISSPNQLSNYLEQPSAEPTALVSSIVAQVVTPLDLDSATLDLISAEWNWLFSAVSHYQQVYLAVQERLLEENKKLRSKGGGMEWLENEMTGILPAIRQEEVERSRDLSLPIPLNAQKSPQAANRVLTIPDKNEWSFYFGGSSVFNLQKHNPLESIFNQINTGLQNINSLQQKQAKLGEAGKYDISLQDSIKNNRVIVTQRVVELASLVDQAYGILVTSPSLLSDYLTQA